MIARLRAYELRMSALPVLASWTISGSSPQIARSAALGAPLRGLASGSLKEPDMKSATSIGSRLTSGDVIRFTLVLTTWPPNLNSLIAFSLRQFSMVSLGPK